MRSILLFVGALLVVGSLSGCGAYNAVDGGALVPSLNIDPTPDTSDPQDCPAGEIWFGSECRKQRGIIIDQKPHVLGIIIDQNWPTNSLPPASFSDANAETGLPVDREDVRVKQRTNPRKM